MYNTPWRKNAMYYPIVTKKKAEAISNGAFLIALGILFLTNGWWPGILLAIWIFLGLRQYLTGRFYDLTLTTVILVGLFIISVFNINLTVLFPVLFVLAGIYLIFREFFFPEDTNGEDKSQEIKDDIDDSKES